VFFSARHEINPGLIQQVLLKLWSMVMEYLSTILLTIDGQYMLKHEEKIITTGQDDVSVLEKSIILIR
jgi:hypothetical protein